MNRIRVLITKIGLDGHDRGAKLVANTLQTAGMEVIYLGHRQTVEQVVDHAIQENIDYLGISFLAGDHMHVVPRVMETLRSRGAGHIKVIIGGIILNKQIPALQDMGVHRVFVPGTPLTEIEQFIKNDSQNIKLQEHHA
jgi:methylmalonyl-CoA mutase C-terminal domain/subunit